MQHFENGIAVKAVVAKLKSEGQACALNPDKSRVNSWLSQDSVENVEKPIGPWPAGHQMRCEGLVLSKRRLPGLFCLKAYRTLEAQLSHFPRWKHDTKR